jgi:hypothetical protein
VAKKVDLRKDGLPGQERNEAKIGAKYFPDIQLDT